MMSPGVPDAEVLLSQHVRKMPHENGLAFGQYSAPLQLLHHAVEPVHLFADLFDEQHRRGVEVGLFGRADRRAEQREVAAREPSAGRAETLSGCAAASMRVQRPKSALRNDSSETIASGFSSAPKRNLPGIVA